MSTYPANIPVFPNLTDEVDVVAANDENSARNEIIALAQYVGTNPQGSRNSFADRMNVCIGSYGGIVNGTGFPADTTPRKLFYRDDTETLYIRNAGNSTWNIIGGAGGNTVFCFVGTLNINMGPAQTTFNTFVSASNSTKFRKISGMNTLYFYMFLTVVSGASNNIVLDINSGLLTSTSTTTSSSGWLSGTMDVSGLVTGSVYDMRYGARVDNSNVGTCVLSSIQVFGA